MCGMQANGERPITVTAAKSPEEVIQKADVVSLHMLLDKSTHHFINKERLAMMKPDAVLVNAARGPVIDEVCGLCYPRVFRQGSA